MTCTAKLRIEDALLKVKQEAPPPVPFATAQEMAHSPVAPGPPRTELPKTKAETKLWRPRPSL